MTTSHDRFKAALQSARATDVGAEDVDWERLDDERAAKVRADIDAVGGIAADTLELFYAQSGNATPTADLSNLATYAEDIDRLELEVERSRAAIGLAQAQYSDAYASLRAAQAERRAAIRAHFADGVSAPELADALGLSLPRVYQLVAGARKR